MDKEIINFIWEVIKLVIPSFVAWKLAVHQSKKEAIENAKSTKKQIKEWRNKNIEAQNKSNKIQFCLNELSKIEIKYEKLISDVNTVAQSVLRARKSQNLLDVKMASEELNMHMHDVMYSVGLTGQLVKTLGYNNFNKFIYVLENMKESGKNVEKTMSCLAQIDGKPSDLQIVNKVYNAQDFKKFSEDVFATRQFMMDVVEKVLIRMG